MVRSTLRVESLSIARRTRRAGSRYSAGFALGVSVLLVAALLPGGRAMPATERAPSDAGSGVPLFAADSAPYPTCVTTEFEGSQDCTNGRLIYDPASGEVVAFLSCVGGPNLLSSCTWTYSNGSWTNITSTDGQNPPYLEDAGWVWDSAAGYGLLFGGISTQRPGFFNQTWEFQYGRWTNLSVASPRLAGTIFPVAQYDTSSSEVVALWQASLLEGGATYAWTYRAGTWTNVTDTSAPPRAFPNFPSSASDPSDGGVLYYGGFNATTGAVDNQTWIFSNGTFHEVAARNAPSPRISPSLGYDSIDGYDLLVGGANTSCSTPCTLLPGEWTFADGRWTNITGTVRGTEPFEEDGQLVTDVAAHAVIEGFGVVGPESEFGTVPQADLYFYVNGTWTSVTPSSAGGPSELLLVLGATAAGVAVALAALVLSRRRRTR